MDSLTGPDAPTIPPRRRDLVPSLELPTVGPPSEKQPFRVGIGVAPGASSPQSLEIQALLHQRLRIVSLIALGAVGAFNSTRFFRLDFTAEEIWRVMVPGAAYLALMAVIAAMSLERTGIQPGATAPV